jgi:Ca-activated chloride channel family protein
MTVIPIDLLDAASTASWPDPDGGLGVLTADDGADALPLSAVALRVRLDGLTAHVELTQTFVNTLDRPANASYHLPLPDRLAVSRFRIEAGPRVIEGEVRERRDEPAPAPPAAGLSAAFDVRVGAVRPGETVTVRIALLGPLACSGNDIEFRFPLTVGPRSTPTVPLTPDLAGGGGGSPVWLARYPNPVRVGIKLDLLPNGLNISALRSSLPAEQRAEDDDGVRRVELRPEGRIERDFILRYRLGGRDTRAALQLLPDGPGETEGTFVLTVVPTAADEGPNRPRDVVIVIDRSAGMAGWKLTAARTAATRVVEALGPKDRFGVLAFDGQVSVPPRFGAVRLVPADPPQRAHAIGFLAGLTDRGGVPEIAPALTAAADLLPDGDMTRDRVLVLVTAAEVSNEDALLRAWSGRASTARLLGLAVGDGASGRFVRRLAEVGGACEVADSPERFEVAAGRLLRRLTAPRLTGLSFVPTGFEVAPESVVPAQPPDVFPGAPVSIRGRYKGIPDGAMKVDGQTSDGRPWTATVPARLSTNPALTSAWATEYVRQLDDRYAAASGERPVLAQRIAKAAHKFRIPSRFTNFIAVERNPAGAKSAPTTPRPRPGDPAEDPRSAGRRGESGPRVGRYTVGDEPIHGYTLLALFGRGQFEETWKARDKASGKIVAIKIIDLAYSPTALKELRSLNLLKNLNHPNLVPIFTARLKDKLGQEVEFDQLAKGTRAQLAELAIATGHGDKSLVDRLAELNPDGTPHEFRQGLPVKELIRYMKGAARGIDFLNKSDHGLGPGDGPIVHCDIKPKNLMIVAGEVQIAGAGFARIIEPDVRQTRMPGSPAYTAPELLSGQPGGGTDQYSLAVSYYELRTGHLPFPAGATLPQIILAHAQGGLDLSEPVVSEAERAVLRRATTKAPVERYETCEEFIEDLAAVPQIRTALKAKKSSSSEYAAAPAPRPSNIFELPASSRRTPSSVSIPSLAEIDLDREEALAAAPGPETDLTPRAVAWVDVSREPPRPGRPSSGTIDFDEFTPPDDPAPRPGRSLSDPVMPRLSPEVAALLGVTEPPAPPETGLSPEALALIKTKVPARHEPPPTLDLPPEEAAALRACLFPPFRPAGPKPPAAVPPVPKPPASVPNSSPSAPMLAPEIEAIIRGHGPLPQTPPRAPLAAERPGTATGPDPSADDRPILAPEIEAIIRGHAAPPPPPATGSAPVLAPEIEAIIRGQVLPALEPMPKTMEPPTSQPAGPPPDLGAILKEPTTPATKDGAPLPLPPKPEVVQPPAPANAAQPAPANAAQPAPANAAQPPPANAAQPPPAGAGVAPIGRKGFGLPVDPADPLGRRYATGVPDAEIQKIIAESQRIPTGKTVRPSPPPPPVGSPPPSPPDVPPLPPTTGRPGGLQRSKETAALPEDEIKRLIIAESERLQAKVRRKSASPADDDKPRRPFPPQLRPPERPPDPPPEESSEPSSGEGSSKPEWYREAVREQRESSRVQVRRSSREYAAIDRPGSPTRSRAGLIWALVLLGLILAVALVIVLVVWARN